MKNIRNYFFWFIDFLKGGIVKKHFNDIKIQYHNYQLEEIEIKRVRILQNLLKHTIKNVSFYKNIVGNIEISSFPIINKNIIKDSLNDFLADNFKNKKLYSTTTSGSTGTPFTVYRDLNKIKRHQAENIFFQEIAGYSLGSKLYYLRVWNEVNKKSFISRFIHNIEAIEISNLSDTNIKKFIEDIGNENSKSSILSFASSLEIIARYIDKHNLKVESNNIKAIITMSEPITEQARTILEKFFNCSVISRYSNMENGFIAQQEAGKNYYTINHASFYIEIFDIEKDDLVEIGTLGRIVITDLFNYAMPLIRYDTGDLGRIIVDKENIPYLSDIEGRRVDFITNTKGQILSPHSITNTMWKFSDVLQFQFIQLNKKEYKIKINIDSDKYKKEEILILDLKEYLGQDASIEVEIVHEIPLLSSGKRKKIVNLMHSA